MQPFSSSFSPSVHICEAGFLFGAETRLASFAPETGRLAIDADRVFGLLATAVGRTPSDKDFSAIESASAYWQRGDKALANLRLVFATLPMLDAPEDVYRLKAAELLFDAGLTAVDLAEQLGSGEPDLGKYDPDQARVPAGQQGGGQWTKGIWSRFRGWLDEDVPVYDPDTGDEVGTQARARAIATNPLTILAVGAAAIVAGEVLLPLIAAGAVVEGAIATATAIEEAEVLSPFVEAEVSISGIAANAARGAESEARVLEDMGLFRNTKSVATEEGRAVPDALTDTQSVEIKDAAYVSRTRQVRIQTDAAKASGRESILVTGEKTRLSKNAASVFNEIIRRPDLGPR